MAPHHVLPRQAINYWDGNRATAHIAHAFTEQCFLYPITPSTPMGETLDKLVANGYPNCMGDQVESHQMQSELGVAGAVHGSLTSGALTTTFTCSQGLMLMLPTLHRIAGDGLPGVIHVATRAVGTHTSNIHCDHSDVMACRNTGVCMLSSNDPQSAHDMAAITHLAAIRAKLPFIHFFDGNRTSHEQQLVKAINYDLLESMIDPDALAEFRANNLHPHRPMMRGTIGNNETYWLGYERNNKAYELTPAIVQETMDLFKEVTGREYRLFDYYGHDDAEEVIAVMGSAVGTVKEVVDYLNSQGKKVGVVATHLYRPFSLEACVDAIPKSCTRLTVLDRVKERGSMQPLYFDHLEAVKSSGRPINVIGGIYGIGGQDFTPQMCMEVFSNMARPKPRHNYTIGVDDDVTFQSMPYNHQPMVNTSKPGTIQCIFYGRGSDGTKTATQTGARLIATQTDLEAQAFFTNDAKKSGGMTVSHLRFSPDKIDSAYRITQADYIGIHQPEYARTVDCGDRLRVGGKVLVNYYDNDILVDQLPAKFKRELAERDGKLFMVNAPAINRSVKLSPEKISTALMAAFFRVQELPQLSVDDSMRLYMNEVKNTFKNDLKKLTPNLKVIEMLQENPDLIQEVTYDKEAWLNATDATEEIAIGDVMERYNNLPRSQWNTVWQGTVGKAFKATRAPDLKVSQMLPFGMTPVGTSQLNQDGVAQQVPDWSAENCIECLRCVVSCPHSAIRPVIFREGDARVDAHNANLPEGAKPFQSIPFIKKYAKKLELQDHQFRIQVAPNGCVGCGVCQQECPADAISMPLDRTQIEASMHEQANWDLAMELGVPDFPAPAPASETKQIDLVKTAVKKPLYEFSGACAGCGETPYIKLLTQVLGERLLIAGATGCSSVITASYPFSALTTDGEGRGPAWSRSLFENNAEHGLGMAYTVSYRRNQIARMMTSMLTDSRSLLNDKLAEAFEQWLAGKEDPEESARLCPIIKEMCQRNLTSDTTMSSRHYSTAYRYLQHILRFADFLPKISVWTIGGDGWAYDIGYAGIDHVLCNTEPVKILVLDNEQYSNTGGQLSHAAPPGVVGSLTAAGKDNHKKDLGLIAMSHRNAYVASIAMGADPVHALRCIKEAEAFDGPAIILALASCKDWRIQHGLSRSQKAQKDAVEAGYWPLYSYNPDRAEPLELHQAGVDTEKLDSFLASQGRFNQMRKNTIDERKKIAELKRRLHESVEWKLEMLKRFQREDAKKE
ncbi:Pyruvate-flavodoxin oxidoreductase [Carpediemonas membranifera]|uniref:Pyruvate-flavodoxin oxidoreductase n=1 Tax=Carpediemonas membranifera TaxID=201153 RepID=A0A8J6E6Y8_9EUKA|nr:Pyruvate-flavodoxin oxidoreductase [Carpediemonas membranifera]|eukprot:KAG9390085.1 Pyruvate-flavodoxin oxidoreductase [Carpediemonas membranifera]